MCVGFQQLHCVFLLSNIKVKCVQFLWKLVCVVLVEGSVSRTFALHTSIHKNQSRVRKTK